MRQFFIDYIAKYIFINNCILKINTLYLIKCYLKILYEINKSMRFIKYKPVYKRKILYEQKHTVAANVMTFMFIMK